MSDTRILTAAMDNLDAWRLGEVANAAVRNPVGDLIDRGLILLRLLNERGYAVTVEINPRIDIPKEVMPNRSAQESCRRDNAPPQPSPAGAMYYDGLVLELLAIHMEKSADCELKTGRKISHTPWSRAADAIQILKAELTRSAPAVTEEMVERFLRHWYPTINDETLALMKVNGTYKITQDGLTAALTPASGTQSGVGK